MPSNLLPPNPQLHNHALPKDKRRSGNIEPNIFNKQLIYGLFSALPPPEKNANANHTKVQNPSPTASLGISVGFAKIGGTVYKRGIF